MPLLITTLQSYLKKCINLIPVLHIVLPLKLLLSVCKCEVLFIGDCFASQRVAVDLSFNVVEYEWYIR